MANRRIGGMGGGPRGARSFSQHQPFQGSGVSPWQGPNNSMNQGLLSNPQQLAMALTSLLQPQQQQPPSLLSLNTSPAFSQNRDFGRFGRGRDMRRHEPYNKNRTGGWKGGNNRRNDRKDNKDDFKKKEEKRDIKVKDEKEEKDGEQEENDEQKKESKEGPYKGIPTSYLHCFVCGKKMWDGESMHNHVKGRAHRQMLESLEESIHLTVNILREHMRLAEEKKVIEFARMQRSSKKYKHDKPPELESYCNMCDLKFMGKIVAHRKNEGHQRIKRYLHPTCSLCEKECPSRMEWVEHRLTPEHLQKLYDSVKDAEGKADGDVIIDEGEPDLEPILDESLQMEAEYPIFELTDDLTGLQNLIPAYKPDRPVSKQSLQPFSGYKCQLCNRSFVDEQLAHEHLATRKHYYAFIDAAKAKFKEEQARKEKEEEAEKKRKEEGNGDAEMYDPEEACQENGKEDTSTDTQDQSALNTTADESQDGEEAEEEEVVVKTEKVSPEKKPIPATPARQTRTTAAAAPPVGGVKNGAGPKSKKARK